jgi:uncharacterized protein
MELPIGALMFVVPLTAALLLVYREDKMRGVWGLLRRVFDYQRIRRKIWYLPIVFLLPAIYLLSYWAMVLVDRPLPEPNISLLAIPLLVVVFFIAATGEEAGYMGYAVDPMQERWSALTTAIVIGSLWGSLHMVVDLQGDHGLAWIAWQRGLYDIALRILIVWIYNNTGRSLFAAILFHDTDNVSVNLFPNDGSHYDPAFTGMITTITAVIVTFLWGAKTLARYRYAPRP